MRGRQKRLNREMAELAVLGSPGPFKARKKDPERMLADFNLYVKSIKNLLTLTDNTEATDAKKKALMQSVGGPDMIWLFDYVGKVAEGDTYAAAIENVKTAITGYHRGRHIHSSNRESENCYHKSGSDEIQAIHRHAPGGASLCQLVDQRERTSRKV